MKRYLLPALLVLTLSVNLFGQSTTYRVRVGTFVDPKLENFNRIRTLGIVYAEEQSSNYFTVFLGGGIASAQEAQQLAQQVRNLGFLSAEPESEVATGTVVNTIQFSSLNAASKVDWEKYIDLGYLYFSVQGKVVKLLAGKFPEPNAAREALAKVRAAGFSDAFLKQMDEAFMHQIGQFELAGIKRPLIPLSINEQATTNPAPTPSTYSPTPPNNYSPTARGGVNTFAGNTSVPEIRRDIRRNSAYELQKVLKAEGFYTGSLDGYYGRGTGTAYQQFIEQNRAMQQYAILARNLDFSIKTGPDDPIQNAINTLHTNAFQSIPVLESSTTAVAFAYRAYYLLTTQGPSNQVNNLMHEALKQAFSDKVLGQRLPININSPYAYMDLTQLLNHLQYVHSATNNTYVVPCWLYSKHPQEIAAARVGFFDYANDSYALESCDAFTQWEDIRIMIAVADDLGGKSATDDRTTLIQNASRRTKLYFLQGPIQNQEIAKQVQTWNTDLFKGLEKWAGSDPLHQKLLLAFKAGYFQSLVRLEDYFLDKGYSEREARTLGIATIHTLVSYQLERFV